MLDNTTCPKQQYMHTDNQDVLCKDGDLGHRNENFSDTTNVLALPSRFHRMPIGPEGRIRLRRWPPYYATIPNRSI